MNDESLTPQNVGIEKAVIAAMLTDAHCCAYALGLLSADCFYMTAHQRIYGAIVKTIKSGYVADILTVVEFLRRNNSLEAVGGEAGVSDIIENVASTSNIKNHCQVLLEKAVLRGVIETFSNGITYAQSSDAIPERVLTTAERRVIDYQKRMQKIGGDQVYEHAGSVKSFIDDISTPLPNGLAGLPWPIEAMNNITGGALRGKTCVLSGYTKGGKSRFLRCCVSSWLNKGYSGVYILTEEDVSSVLRCILACRCRVDTKSMMFHNCSDVELARLKIESVVLAKQNLVIEKKLSASPAYVDECIDRAGNALIKQGKKLDFCVLDTCTKMEKDGCESPVKMHQEMAEDLLGIADRSGVAMIEVMQYLSDTDRGTRTKSALHSQVRFGQFYLESASTSISFDDRRKSKKEIENERKRKYKVVKAHIVQREGESFGFVDAKAELQYSNYSDATTEEVNQETNDQKTDSDGFFDGTTDTSNSDGLPF